MAWWTDIGDTSSDEFQISELHDNFASPLKKNTKSNTHPISNLHKSLLVLLLYRKVELFLNEPACVTDVSICWYKKT